MHGNYQDYAYSGYETLEDIENVTKRPAIIIYTHSSHRTCFLLEIFSKKVAIL